MTGVSKNGEEADDPGVDPRLLEVLVCPVTRTALTYDREANELVSRAATDGSGLTCTVNLTDGRGGPRCARVDPPAISWTLDR